MQENDDMQIQEISAREEAAARGTFFAAVERAVKIEEELKHQRELLISFREDTNRRFDQMFKYFEISREESNQRFEDVNRRFEDMFKYLEMSREDSNIRFEDINKRFEDINKRFEDINIRFEDMNKRFDTVDKNFTFILRFSIWFGSSGLVFLTFLMTLYKFL